MEKVGKFFKKGTMKLLTTESLNSKQLFLHLHYEFSEHPNNITLPFLSKPYRNHKKPIHPYIEQRIVSIPPCNSLKHKFFNSKLSKGI